VIEFNSISKRFASLQVLDAVSLEMFPGDCIALLGPNGCGKTTLIKILLGMVLPDSGTVYFNNKNVKGDVTYKQNIGYMPQIGRYPENMQVGQVIEMLKDIRKTIRPMDNTLYEDFNISSIAHKYMGSLSGGTTQKVSATLAFMFDPDVLVLDEPTAGLDPLSSEILRDKIVQVRKDGKLVLITSHLLSELDDMISSVVFMQDGKILFSKSVPELMRTTGEEKISKAINYILKM